MENHIESITGIKDEKWNEIRVYCENVFYLNLAKPRIRIKLETEYLIFIGTKRQSFIAHKIDLKFRKVHRKVVLYPKREIKESPKSHLIQISIDLIKKIKETCQTFPSQLIPDTMCFQLHCQLQPDFISSCFSFPFALSCSEILYSPCLFISGTTWRLKIYPRGNGVAKDQYLSVFLEMVSGVQEGAKYEYKIEMQNRESDG
jgi:tripartite motif-containing protein 37